MKIINSIKVVVLIAAVAPLVFVFFLADPALIKHKDFNQVMSFGLGLAIFLGLLGPYPVMWWIFDDPLRQLRTFCIRVKMGDYSGFTDLPNEAIYQEYENEFVTLKRDMNWMAHQIKVRERQLENTISELHATKSELISQKQAFADANIRLTEMAMTDPLTGLSNRRHFFEHLEQEICRSQRGLGPLSLLILDIDHFKCINDQYGHQCGDKVLEQFASVMQRSISKGDLAARIGGEEFAVLLADAGCVEALRATHRIHRAIQEHCFLDCNDNVLSVTCSIGLCSVENMRFISAQVLHQKADDALYAAKSSGRNCIKHCKYENKILLNVQA